MVIFCIEDGSIINQNVSSKREYLEILNYSHFYLYISKPIDD